MRFSQFENTIWGGSSDGASDSSDSKANVWQLFFQEGNIRMYRRELEREGRVIDPLKAVHVVRGILTGSKEYILVVLQLVNTVNKLYKLNILVS